MQNWEKWCNATLGEGNETLQIDFIKPAINCDTKPIHPIVTIEIGVLLVFLLALTGYLIAVSKDKLKNCLTRFSSSK